VEVERVAEQGREWKKMKSKQRKWGRRRTEKPGRYGRDEDGEERVVGGGVREVGGSRCGMG